MFDPENDTVMYQSDENVVQYSNLFRNVLNVGSDEFIGDPDEFIGDFDEFLEAPDEFVEVLDEFIDDPDEFTTHEDNSTSTEIRCKTSSERISDYPETDTSEITSVSSQSTKDEEINDELILLEPDNPLMDKFQNTLHQHLLKQKDSIRSELLALEAVVKSKHNEKSLLFNESNRAAGCAENHRKVLCEYQRIKTELTTTKGQVDTYIDQGKQRYADIATKIKAETKRVSDIKRTLECKRGLLNELAVYRKEQEMTLSVCEQKGTKTKQNFKKLLNEKENQNLLLSSLSLEILRMEFDTIEFDKQTRITRTEWGSMKQKLMDKSTDLDALTRDNNTIKSLWNDVLVCIQQRDKSCQKIKHDLMNAKNKYNVLLLESDSYTRSVEEELTRNNRLSAMSKRLKHEHDSLQDTFNAYFDKIATTKEKRFDSLQIIESQEHNLDRVMLEQKSIKTETNKLLKSLDESNSNKRTHEEDHLEELRKQTFSDGFCAQINKKILQVAGDIKQHELALVSNEKILAECLLKLEQYYITLWNLEKGEKENAKYLNDHERAISALNSELNKLYTKCQLKSKQIEANTKELDSVNRKLEDGVLINVHTKIDRARFDIGEIEKEIDLIKKSWIERQIKNVLLSDRSNTQSAEVRKVHSIVTTMNMKSTRLLREITDLSIENENYTRRIADTRYTIVKLHNIFYTQKGQSNQLLNENEWMHSSYLTELQDSERKLLDYLDAYKFLKDDLEETKNACSQKILERNSWDSKLQLLTDMKNEKKIGEGDTGDIRAMKNEIRKLQFRENQLRKTLKRKMSDLEKCISRRDQIYSAFAANNARTKRKHDTRIFLLKKINDLRTDIKKIQRENKNLDRNIIRLQHGELEVECKLTDLKEESRNLQQHIDDFNEQFDAIGVTKLKNMQKLIYKQSYIKLLDEVKNGKYRLLIQCESKMNEGYEIERKKNSDLTTVVDALKNDFPHLDSQFTFLLNTLKSVEN